MPDLRGVFVGSEGMLGVATEVCVKLTQNYPAVRTMLMDFADVGDGQEIRQNLSTFASHLVRIRAGLERAGPRTLVLLDGLDEVPDKRAHRERDQELNRKREEERRRRERNNQLKQLVMPNARNDAKAELPRHFEHNGKIRKLYVTSAQQEDTAATAPSSSQQGSS